MSDPNNWYRVAEQIGQDLSAQGIDLTAHRFFACVKARHPFSKYSFVPLGMPFDFIHEMARAIASRNGPPVYVLDAANRERPVIFVENPSDLLSSVED